MISSERILQEPFSQETNMKTKTCLLRMTEHEHYLFAAKSKILGTNKSTMFRNGAMAYWNGHAEPDTDMFLKLYQDGSSEEKSTIVDILFKYYRIMGYPHRNLSADELRRNMRTLSVTKDPLLDNGHLQSNTTGLALANHFHHHMVKVRCLTNYRSPYDQFSDDDLLRDSINRWMELGQKASPSGLRRILRTRDGVRSVVNFKPAIAKYFYDNYCPHNGRVLDPCAGYGGRLAGCIASNKGITYQGIDPQGSTGVGNMRMASFYSRQKGIEREWKFGFDFILGCAEDRMKDLSDKSCDLIFTSPPFFDVEKYDTDSSQSYIRYPVYEEWKRNFLAELIKESSRIVKTDGHVIFNIKNYKNKAIADDLCFYCQESGLRLVKTYQMRLVNSEYNRKEGQNNWHTEPIFVFVVSQ